MHDSIATGLPIRTMETLDQKLSTAEVCKRIQTALDNMGRALKCPVCLSTLREKPVVLSSCVHAFCQSCLSRSFESSKEASCPICKVPCHRRRSVSEAPFLGELAHSYQRTLRHFGLTPVKYTSTLPLLTQLGPEENCSQHEDDLAMVHRHFQVSKTFEMAMRQDKLAARNSILQQHQSVVEANGKVLLDTIVKRKNVDVRKPTVQFTGNLAVSDSSDHAKERTKDSGEGVASTEEQDEEYENNAPIHKSSNAIHASFLVDHLNSDGKNTSNKSCLKSTPSSREQKLAIRSSASKLSVQFQSLSPILVATHESGISTSLHNVKEMTGKVSGRSSNVANSDKQNEVILNKTDSKSDNNISVPTQQSSTLMEPNVEGGISSPILGPKSVINSFGYNSKISHQTPETDKSSESIFPASEGLDLESFEVGDIIDVKSRSWPGINKQGGIAKIVKVNDDKSYDVSYVLGGKEKRVDAVFCSIHHDSLPDRKKDSIPVCLLQQLASEGFDVKGNQVNHQSKIDTASVSRPRSVAVRKCELASTKRRGPSGKEKRKKRPKMEQINEATDSRSPFLEYMFGLPTPETNSLADSLYQCRIAAAINKQQIVVLASGLADYDAAQLKELEKRSKKWEGKPLRTRLTNFSIFANFFT